MNTYRYTPEKIVQENLYFSIPLYQRLFAWKEEQVKGLLYDLKRHFDKHQDDSPYYLGMLSCIKSNSHYDLIDGQQRFTVMMLMAIVLKEYHSDGWNKFLDNAKRLEFVARTKDNEYLKAKVNCAPVAPALNYNMEAGIKQISDFMSNSEIFGSDNARAAFSSNVYHRMSFFFSKLPNSYMYNPSSLNKYFEAMNASGKGLEQHEILKVQLLQEESEAETQKYLTQIWNAVSDMNRPLIKKEENTTEEDYRSKYNEAINHCRKKEYRKAFDVCEKSYDLVDEKTIGQIDAEQQNFNQYKIETGDSSLISFSEYLMLVIDLYLDLKGSYSFYREELLTVFSNNHIADVKDFYENLLYYRLLLDFYIIHKEGDDNANKYNIVFRSESSTEALKQYQSMLYVSQTQFYNWLKPILYRLSKENPTDTSQLLGWIKEIDNSLHARPESPEALSYDCRVDRYWFWRLDYYLWEKRDLYFKEDDREIVDGYVFRANRSIEHLHPQHQVNNDEWKIDDIHSFGNLAMISQSFNSQQSDDPVTVKFARIADQAHNHSLQSIKMYRMYLDAQKNPEGWTKDIKDVHQEQMFDLLVKSYNIE